MQEISYSLRRRPDPGMAEAYDPDAMLNALMRRTGVSNDAELAARLQLDERTIDRIRRRRLPVSPSMLYAIHSVTGIAVDDLRRLLKDRRRCFR